MPAVRGDTGESVIVVLAQSIVNGAPGIANEVGSLLPGKRADIAIVALDETSLLPWEDAQTAVVLDGSPERVVLTVVDGETKYEKGEFEWDVLRSASAAARSRMLAGGSSATRAER